MKKIFFALIMGLIIYSGAFSADISGGVYLEAGTGILNSATSLNPSNVSRLNEMNTFFQGSLNFKTEKGEIFGDYARGALKILTDYQPSYYYGTNYEMIYVKEVYIDAIWDSLILRAGKQYIKWGSSTFFNPIDIINLQRNPLKPLDNEGNPFVYFFFPIKEFLSLEMMTLFKPGETTNLASLPVIPKLSFSYDMVSVFLFTQLEKNKRPFYGGNTDLAVSLSQDITLKLYTEASYFDNSAASNFVLKNGWVEMEKAVPEDQPYQFSVMAGSVLTVSFPEFKYLTSLDISVEYLHDESAWSRDNWNNYLDSLDTVSVYAPAFYQLQGCYQAFKASKDYAALGLSLNDLVTDGLFWNQFAVVNLTDYSFQYNSDVSYQFKNNNATLGFRMTQNFGEKRTEFSSQLFGSQYTLYIFVGI